MNRLVKAAILNQKPALIDEMGRVLIDNITVGIGYMGTTWNKLFDCADGAWTMEGDCTKGILSCNNASIEYIREGEGIKLRTTYTHVNEQRKKPEKFFTLCGMWRCGFESCLYNEYAPGGLSLNMNDMQSVIRTVRFTDGQRIQGSDNVAIIDAEGNNALIGYASFRNYFTNFDIGSEGRVQTWSELEGHTVNTGDVLQSDWLYIGLCDDVRYGLIDYAKIVAKEMNSRGGIAETPYGYCTWYYYGGGLNQKTVYENLEALNANKDRLDVKYFNLDDGWLKEWGDWTENDKFADCGMKKIADDIRAEGYLPGIWLAPLGVKTPSEISEAHPDWFVKDLDKDENVVMWSLYNLLDMSHPEVKAYIKDVFHRVSYEWGYRHIKIDILSPCLVPGRYYDPSFNALKNYREGLRLIRESITEDTVLLTCTAPMGSSVGYADSMRTSRDIFEDWNCLLTIFNENLKRYYYNKIWFNNDPDCILVRNARNEDEECIRQCTRTDMENRTFAAALMATGGAVIMSDKMPLLEEYQLELLKKMFPINTQAAIPLDLMTSEYPGILDLGKREKTHIFVLINWTDAEKRMSLNIGNGNVFEFWGQNYLGKPQGECVYMLEPHESKILFVTEQSPISVLGVDDCLCPTMKQSYADGKLSAVFIKKGEVATVYSEKPIKAVIGCEIEAISNNLYHVKQIGESLDFCVEEA